MKNISLKGLIEADDFKAKSKETGKLVHFKSKDAYQAALKAGTHKDPNAKKGEQPKAAAKPNDMFGGDYSKDRGGEAPKADSMATVNSIAAKTGLRAQAVAGWADENGVNLSNLSADIDSKKLKPMDLMTAISGNPGNKYAKDIIAKYSQSGGEAPKAETPKVNLPKKASQLTWKDGDTIADMLNKEAGLEGITDTMNSSMDPDNNTIAYTASSGDEPTYTLYMGMNDDYGKPDEFRVSLESTYGNDPSSLQGKIDKSFKSADEAMKFMIAVAKKYKKELEMDDEDTNESTKLTKMIKK
jgi:hypothetical protein